MQAMRVRSSLLFFALAAASSAQTGYRKIEAMVPMRDGVKLYTAVYVPEGKTGPFPILLERTPYSAGPYGPTHMKPGFRGSPKLQAAGYAFGFQDVRGRYMSEGSFVDVRPQLKRGEKGTDESTDTYDTVDWLVKNVPGNNGSVGMWGISYPGGYTALGGINSHPALKAISPQAPVSDWFVGDDFHHNGALFLQDAYGFLRGFGQPRPVPSPTGTESAPPAAFGDDDGAYAFHLKTGALSNYNPLHLHDRVAFWNDILAHGTYDDFWKSRALPDKMKGVKCAVLYVGGWFDAEDMWGPLHDYAATERQNRGTYNALVMGPWFHGMWAGRAGGGQTFGDLDFGSPTATYFQDQIEFPFFEHFLRNQPVTPPAEVSAFQTGANRWRTFEQWPPKGLKKETFFFAPHGGLGMEKGAEGPDSYVSDPANPTPYLADPKAKRRTREYMIDDQRFLEGRPDVVSYKLPAFDADTTFAGPVTADLWVTTTGTDADFIVKVIDIWPSDAPEESANGVAMAGYQQLLRVEVMRGKFRDSLSDPKPFVPGKPTRVKFALNDLLHTFRKGHTLMVQVQSSWYPLVDRNPNQFLDIYRAKDSDFQKATIQILCGGRYASSLGMGSLGR
ncbi:CocE/NonD family hydrolase [soil metagenome]